MEAAQTKWEHTHQNFQNIPKVGQDLSGHWNPALSISYSGMKHKTCKFGYIFSSQRERQNEITLSEKKKKSF